jgi:DNA-binding XRE family transcriptional regulator
MASTTFMHMTVTPKGAEPAPTRARPPGVRLRVEAYDILAAAKGYPTVESQAELHGVNRGTIFRLRAGHRLPRVDLAMRIASDLGTTVEFLFERVT